MCELCSGETSIIFKDANNKWAIRVENSNWDEYNDCLDYTNLEIDYCPWCGRKLEKKEMFNKYIEDFISTISNEFPQTKFNYKYDSKDDIWEITYPYSNEKDINKSKLGKIIREILLDNDVYNFSISYELESEE